MIYIEEIVFGMDYQFNKLKVSRFS